MVGLRLTDNARDAFAAAQALAMRARDAVVDREHLLAVPVTQDNGIVPMLLAPIGEGTAQATVMESLRPALPAELLNRVDEVLAFQPLRHDGLVRIASMELDLLGQRMQERGITLCVADAARHALVEMAGAETNCARLLKRTVQRVVMDPLATGLLDGSFDDGDAVRGDVSEGQLCLQVFPRLSEPLHCRPCTTESS